MVFMCPQLLLFVTSTRCKANRTFLDSLRLHVVAGPGGMGFPKHGGLGGHGGSIYMQAKKDTTLKEVLNKYPSKKVTATGGENAHLKKTLGENGPEVVISVPPGVTAYSQTGIKLGEVNREDEKVLLVRGGIGGCKDNGFCGRKGESQVVTLDLKLVADIGLLGFPNAGKSTLLSALSNAKPKIAEYPFTTLQPQLGVVKYQDLREITVADLPGLIEGAHMNRGMGSSFLKHFERTRAMLTVVDINGFQLRHEYPHRSCLETIALLNKELELYNEELLKKPTMLVINKNDSPGAETIFRELATALKSKDGPYETLSEDLKPLKKSNTFRFDGGVIAVSAKEGHGLNELRRKLRDFLGRMTFNDFDEKEDMLTKTLTCSVSEKGPLIT